MCKKCGFPDGITIRPDGVNELSPHLFEDIEIHKNVTVIVSKCVRCGEMEVSWIRQEDTEDNVLNQPEE